MKLVLSDNQKINILKSFFGLLKNSNSLINMVFYTTHFFIQGMDKSHICLYEIKLLENWFNTYQTQENETYCVNVNYLFLILNNHKPNQTLTIFCEKDVDKLSIQFMNTGDNKKDFNTIYEINLMDFDSDFMEITPSLYDIHLTIDSEKFQELTNKLLNFGDNMNISGKSDCIQFSVEGEIGKMESNIHKENLINYQCLKDIVLSFSLTIINKYCLSNKLTNHINMFIGENSPMKINYDLGNESYIDFYIAPKINDVD
jgi:proliferating cell nuclear antigen